MKISDKLLVEQAWSLKANLNRRIETEKGRRAKYYPPSIAIERLNSVQDIAYSRYLRRLKKFWG